MLELWGMWNTPLLPSLSGPIPGRVIPKTQKVVLDAALLNTQHYKARIKGQMEQSKETSV